MVETYQIESIDANAGLRQEINVGSNNQTKDGVQTVSEQSTTKNYLLYGLIIFFAYLVFIKK